MSDKCDSLGCDKEGHTIVETPSDYDEKILCRKHTMEFIFGETDE